MSDGSPQRADHASVPVARHRDGVAETTRDDVVVEEPLEVRVGDRSILVTMRTPGHDFDLVRGLLFSEGLVERADGVTGVAWCRDVPVEARGNVVVVALAEGVELDEERTLRAGLVSSGCGVCGKTTLEAVAVDAPAVPDGPTIDAAVLASLPERLAERQDLFARTGGLHAAALFDVGGRLLSVREDVGRHNAVDKVVGEALRFGRVPLRDTALMVSGRAGFEIVQKARRAGVPIVCSVSAPSSLAIDVAREGNQTLVGFLRGEAFNVYAGGERIVAS